MLWPPPPAGAPAVLQLVLMTCAVTTTAAAFAAAALCHCSADRLKKMAIKQNSGSTANTAAAGTAAAAAAAKPGGRTAGRAAARAAASQLADGSDDDGSDFDLEVRFDLWSDGVGSGGARGRDALGGSVHRGRLVSMLLASSNGKEALVCPLVRSSKRVGFRLAG